MNRFLIPANSKKSQLILGFFTLVDLIIFLVGCIVTLMLLIIIKSPGVVEMIVMLIPLFTASFLIMPVPHYHNILQLITNIIMFFSNRRRYFWKGWCSSE